MNIVFVLVAIFSFVILYVLPILIIILGIKLIKTNKEKNLGIILTIVGGIYAVVVLIFKIKDILTLIHLR